MDSDYDFASAVNGRELADPAEVGRRAGERAVRRLHAKKPPTRRLPVVFDPRISNSLLRHLAGAISGPSIARGTSFLKDQIDRQVFAQGITTVDDPTPPHGLPSQTFDRDRHAHPRKTHSTHTHPQPTSPPAAAISGPSIARGTSFLKDKLDRQVVAKGITIVDDPHRPHGLASKPFDGEGLANRRMNIIDDGRLTTWVLDLSSARQLGLESTGHAARGTSSPPSPSTSNLYMEPGRLSPAELMADIQDGFYVTSLMGMGINGVTGDYSRGASGFRIEKGELTTPISEATVAGNLKDMFLNLTPADDLVFKYGANAPTLRIDGMTLAGN